MKKTYISPKMTAVKMGNRKMLCASIKNVDGNLQVTFDNDTFGEDETINARGTSFWDE